MAPVVKEAVAALKLLHAINDKALGLVDPGALGVEEIYATIAEHDENTAAWPLVPQVVAVLKREDVALLDVRRRRRAALMRVPDCATIGSRTDG